jgi:hypothetical protein
MCLTGRVVRTSISIAWSRRTVSFSACSDEPSCRSRRCSVRVEVFSERASVSALRIGALLASLRNSG